MPHLDPVELSLFATRLAAICDEMGAVLRRTAFSPNIRERLDFSCALFTPEGRLIAQAAHIPVHLGSMAYAMGDIVRDRNWSPGDTLVFNDPFLGGTHLPDITMVMPVLVQDGLVGFVANRAHHADIGASAPGSMPLSLTVEEEGVLIAPMPLDAAMALLTRGLADPARAAGDFAAQNAANLAGARRLQSMAQDRAFAAAVMDLDAYGARMARTVLGALPQGSVAFEDCLDDDGAGSGPLPIKVRIDINADGIVVDFTGSAPQCRGNLNCPIPVTAAAVWYAFRCLMPASIPACHGVFNSISIIAPEGSLVNARHPAAVAAGNVETSQRIVDVVLGALARLVPERICAAAQGTMNNIALGSRDSSHIWDYYETVGGGLGAHPGGDGLSGVQAHMTNTLNTPAESLELDLPLRVRCYQIRRGSGGPGRYRGGDGLVREIEATGPATATLITERRTHAPWGLAGGSDALRGRNLLNGTEIASKVSVELKPGDRLRVETPGGGGWGPPAL